MEGCESPKKPTNCGVMGFYNGVFRHRNFWSRRTASSGSIPSIDPNESLKDTSSNSKRRRGTNIVKAGFLRSKNSSEEPLTGTTATTTRQSEKSNIKYSTTAAAHVQNRVGRRPSNAIVPASNVGGQTKAATGRVQKEITFSGELDSYIPDYRSKVNGTLVRATSSNMMVFGHLGNIRQPGNQPNSNNVLDHLPMTAREKENAKGVNRNGVMGNIVRKPVEKEAGAGVLCRALSKRLEPEELKVMGNEEYKKGRFAEALALYDRAIAMDPDKASYRSNKSAALTGLGRLLEAIEECREAVRLEPSYTRAHHRLGSLYHRLGDAEKAQKHYKLSGDEANVKEIEKVRVVQTHLCKCNDARKLRDWHTMLKEARCAVSAGADSAPQVFALQAEALLKLHRHQEADTTLSRAPAFDADASTRFFGAARHAYQLLIRAQVDVAAGRFDDAVAKAQQAARLDPSNKEVGVVVRRCRAVALARSDGNELFKASKFGEASAAYGEGLQHDPQNSVLLCNRAACRSKLGQWEKAIEDCTSALNVRPSYSKARLRRAHCNAKLERWEASIQDYEALIREMPGDEEVGRSLFEAQVQLKKQLGEDVKDMKFGDDVVIVTSNDQFRHFVTAPGMTVVLFCNKWSDVTKHILSFTQQLCKRYPSVNFLKVDIEGNPYVVKSEGVSVVPAFKIYKNGSRVRDIIDCTNQDLLETSVKYFST
ncbi:hypothetical protein AAC387_Pa04g2972 [Persea americana]